MRCVGDDKVVTLIGERHSGGGTALRRGTVQVLVIRIRDRTGPLND